MNKIIDYCPVCNKTTLTTEFLMKDYIEIEEQKVFYSVDICHHCGIMFSKERSEYKKLYTTDYDPEREHGHQNKDALSIFPEKIWNYKKKYLQVQELLNLIKSSKISYLEIGASDGSLFRLLRHFLSNKKITIRSTLVESSGASEPCELLPNCTVIIESILNANIEGSYDIAVLSHCLEHFEKPREVILKVRQSLKDNGILYIEVPDGVRTDRSIAYPLGYYHVLNFNLFNLSYLVRDLGFKIIDIIQRDNYPGLRIIAEKTKTIENMSIDNISYIWSKSAYIEWEKLRNIYIESIRKIDRELKNEKILIFGLGTHTKALINEFNDWLDDSKSDLTDSNSEIKNFMGRKCVPISDLNFEKYKYVFISSYAYQNEIARRLLSMGCENEKIIKLYSSIFSYDPQPQ